MWDLIGTVASAFGLVFLAELGDKTQLLALGFGARYPFRTVLLGLALGFGAAGAVAAIVGGVLGAALPSTPSLDQSRAASGQRRSRSYSSTRPRPMRKTASTRRSSRK